MSAGPADPRDAADRSWLLASQAERMDPTAGLFDARRAAFHLSRYRFASAFAPEHTVADVACGAGYGSRIMADAGAVSVVGIDNNGEAIEYAARIHGGKGIEYRFADAADTRIESGSIDLVVSFETLEHVDDDHRVVAEFKRIMAPGGVVIASVPHLWLGEFPHHKRVYDRLRFLKLLEGCGLEVEVLYNCNSGSDWPLNHGRAAGIILTDDDNVGMAECLMAVARGRN